MKEITQNKGKVYCGIDVHKKSYSISIWIDGREVKKWTRPAEAEMLIKELKNKFGKAKIYSVYEAGFSGFVLHRKLVEAGIENMVVNPASIEMAAKDRRKNDRLDARKLGEQLSMGRLRCIYVPSLEEEQAREITRVREQVARSKTRVGVQIKQKMHYYGLVAYDERRVVGPGFLKELELLLVKEAEQIRFAFELLIAQWRQLHKQLAQINVRMQEQSLEDSYNESIYRSVPGIGPVGARTLSNELGDLSKRFLNQRALYQFTGLTPSEHSSGESIRTGNIDRQGSARLRKILVESSWVAVGKDPNLKEVYLRIANRRGAKRAIVAIARKLIGRIRGCFLSQELYKIAMT